MEALLAALADALWMPLGVPSPAHGYLRLTPGSATLHPQPLGGQQNQLQGPLSSF